MFGEKRDRAVLLDDITVTLSLDCLRQVGLVEGRWGARELGRNPPGREGGNVREFTKYLYSCYYDLLSNNFFKFESEMNTAGRESV